jgi:hypothetical protein
VVSKLIYCADIMLIRAVIETEMNTDESSPTLPVEMEWKAPKSTRITGTIPVVYSVSDNVLISQSTLF